MFRSSAAYRLYRSFTCLVGVLTVVVWICCLSPVTAADKGKVYKVAVLRTAPPYAVDIENALKKSLTRLGYEEGKNLVYLPTKVVRSKVEEFWQNAEIAKKLLAQGPDIVATIGTQASVPVYPIVEPTKTPMVFSGVTYPVQGKLIKAFNEPTRRHITGIGYAVPVTVRMKAIRSMFPDKKRFKKIAFIYSGQVLQELEYVKELRSLNNPFGWETVYVNYFDFAQNSPSYRLLMDKLKALDPDLAFGWYSLDSLGNDKMSLSNLISEFNKPVISITSNPLKEGAIGGALTDHDQLGAWQAAAIDRILKGEEAGNIPPVEPKEYVYELNLKKAREFGIHFDPAIVKTARRVVR